MHVCVGGWVCLLSSKNYVSGNGCRINRFSLERRYIYVMMCRPTPWLHVASFVPLKAVDSVTIAFTDFKRLIICNLCCTSILYSQFLFFLFFFYLGLISYIIVLISVTESALSFAFHAANFAFNGLLIQFIQVMYPGSPTAFQSHPVSMITSLISLCLSACGIMLRMILKAKDFPLSLTILNHALVYSGILTPVSLVSVFLPYKPLCLVFFICLLFSATLAHYFFQNIEAAVISMSTRVHKFVVDRK